MSATPVTVYVGNLDQRYRIYHYFILILKSFFFRRVTENTLLEYFAPMGAVTTVKIIAVCEEKNLYEYAKNNLYPI